MRCGNFGKKQAKGKAPQNGCVPTPGGYITIENWPHSRTGMLKEKEKRNNSEESAVKIKKSMRKDSKNPDFSLETQHLY